MRVKICGLTRPDDVRQAIEAGASYVGLVFYPASPRNLSFERAAELLSVVPAGVIPVALLVDPDDTLVDRVVGLGVGMLHCMARRHPSAWPTSEAGRAFP